VPPCTLAYRPGRQAAASRLKPETSDKGVFGAIISQAAVSGLDSQATSYCDCFVP